MSLRPEIGEALDGARRGRGGGGVRHRLGADGGGALRGHRRGRPGGRGAAAAVGGRDRERLRRGPRDRVPPMRTGLGVRCASTRWCIASWCCSRSPTRCSATRCPRSTPRRSLDDLADCLGQWTYLVVGGARVPRDGGVRGPGVPGRDGGDPRRRDRRQGRRRRSSSRSRWSGSRRGLGDTASFYIGTRLGKDFILRHGQRVRITPERFAQVEDYFSRHGGKTILVGRFLGLVRALAPFIAGSSGMRYRAFLPYSVLGHRPVGRDVLAARLRPGREHRAWPRTSRAAASSSSARSSRSSSARSSRSATCGCRRTARSWSRRMEETRLGEPLVVALGRRIEPQARFLWHRVTPGNLGLEFTTIDGGAGGLALHRDRLRRDRRRRSGADAGRREGVRDRRRPALGLVHGRERGGDDAGLGSVTLAVALVAAVCARAGPALAGAGGARGRRSRSSIWRCRS